MTLAMNSLQAVSVRLLTPWNGVWLADVDFDLADASAVPSGPATVTIGAATLNGTIDPLASGRLGAHARARVVGGAGGWSKIVRAQDFHNDSGVTPRSVLVATASEVGETLTIRSAPAMGTNVPRSAGPASRVLAGIDWFVDATGATIVGPRSTSPAPDDVEIMAWDPLTKTADLATDTIVVPGMTLTHPTLFDGTMIVRRVEQTFDESGARAVAWCSTSDDGEAADLVTMLTRLVSEKLGAVYLAPRRYRVVRQAVDGRLELQIVKRANGLPDALPISVFYGSPGVKSKPKPGAIVIVDFVDGDGVGPTPIVRSFDDQTPIELDIDATLVKVGAGTAPVAKLTPSFVAWIAAVSAYVNGLAPGTATPPADAASTKMVTE